MWMDELSTCPLQQTATQEVGLCGVSCDAEKGMFLCQVENRPVIKLRHNLFQLHLPSQFTSEKERRMVGRQWARLTWERHTHTRAMGGYLRLIKWAAWSTAVEMEKIAFIYVWQHPTYLAKFTRRERSLPWWLFLWETGQKKRRRRRRNS